MSRTSARRRFAVPIALAAGIVTAAAGTGIVNASGATDLPDRTAAQLLEDVQTSDVDGLSGTVIQNANLGLPSMGSAAGGLSKLGSGSNELRLWYASPDKTRIAVLNDYGESDTIRNGAGVWTWDSEGSEATHFTLPKKAAELPMWPPSELGADPAKAAEQALAAIEPTTKVTTSEAVEVAGRDAYQLVLEPKDADSLVDRVTLAIDAEHKVPLRTQVFSDDQAEAAFDIGFSRIDFGVPDKENFTFTAPKGVTVKEGNDSLEKFLDKGQKPADDAEVKTVGEGWTTVVTGEFDLDKLAADAKKDGKGKGGEDVDMKGMLDQLPEVSGDWGSGRLFESELVTVLLTDDGRFLAGAVTPERLYDVADGK